MNNSSYPALLNKRARIFVSLNRIDLILLGMNFLICSKSGFSIYIIMLSSFALLALSKFIEANVERGFFRFLNQKRIIDWKYKLGGLNDNL